MYNVDIHYAMANFYIGLMTLLLPPLSGPETACKFSTLLCGKSAVEFLIPVGSTLRARLATSVRTLRLVLA